MEPLSLPSSGLIKICGISRPEDAALCAQAGADLLGFIFSSSSPRAVSPQKAAAFDSGSAKRVGVFADQNPEEVLAIMRESRLDMAQLHGGQDENFIRQIGAERVISVYWPEKFPDSDERRQKALESNKAAAFYLFDAGGGGGGHGRLLKLDKLEELKPPRPWFLAGGLDAGKVESLDLKKLPGLAGFDFNSALEDQPGIKNENKVRAAISSARRILHKNIKA